jgi:hypothetical protein
MITFAGGEIDTDTLYHENMHQWWGDHVTEASYNLTFFKEGMATLAEFLFAARRAQAQAGGPGTEAGRRAFQHSLVRKFNAGYASKGRFWTAAPANPTPYGLFSGSATYSARASPTSPCARSWASRALPGRCGGSSATSAGRHYRGPARSGVPPLAADPEPGVRRRSSTSSSRSGSAPPTSPAVAPAGPITGPGLAGPVSPAAAPVSGSRSVPVIASARVITRRRARRRRARGLVTAPRGGGILEPTRPAAPRRLILRTRPGRLCPWTLVCPSCRWTRSRC